MAMPFDVNRDMGRATLPAFDTYPIFAPNARQLDTNGVVAFDGLDSRVRPFKLLRTQFTKRLAQSGARLVGITSAAPAAGKSFIALNLAAALSRVTDKGIFLVDFDLRRGSVANELGITVENGISDYLAGATDDIGSLGVRIANTRLVVFPTKELHENTAELLSGERCTELVDIFRNNADGAVVLFDLPPVFANDDTMIMVDQLDGYVMVVDSGISTRRQVQQTVAMLQPKPCLGGILNRYKGGLLENYGYGYDYGYEAGLNKK